MLSEVALSPIWRQSASDVFLLQQIICLVSAAVQSSKSKDGRIFEMYLTVYPCSNNLHPAKLLPFQHKVHDTII